MTLLGRVYHANVLLGYNLRLLVTKCGKMIRLLCFRTWPRDSFLYRSGNTMTIAFSDFTNTLRLAHFQTAFFEPGICANLSLQLLAILLPGLVLHAVEGSLIPFHSELWVFAGGAFSCIRLRRAATILGDRGVGVMGLGGECHRLSLWLGGVITRDIWSFHDVVEQTHCP